MNFKKTRDTFIIAEIGAKYSSIKNIIKIIKSAKKIGADAVKFQTYRAKNLSDQKTKLPFKKKITQYDFFKKHQLSHSDHLKIIKTCKKIGIPWFSTPANFSDVDYLDKLNPFAFKIGSDDLTNIPLIEHIAKKKRKIFISTGMCKMKEIEKAIKHIEKFKNYNIVIFHCTSDYPTELRDANLNLIKTYLKKFKYDIGLSDHTNNDLTSIIATTLGAKYIEKHLMPSSKIQWQDKESSLNENDFESMVFKIRNFHKIFGKRKKVIFNCEKKWRKIAKKSIYLSKNIKSGKKIKFSDLVIRRPAGKSEPIDIYEICKKRAAKNLIKDQNIHFGNVR